MCSNADAKNRCRRAVDIDMGKISMRQINLSQGKVAILDDDDFDRLA